MSEAVAAVRRPLNSPRAAALAGVLFAVLFTTALALMRTALPETLTADSDWLNDASVDCASASVWVSCRSRASPSSGSWGSSATGSRTAEDQLFSSVFIGSGLLFLAMVFVSAAIAGGIVASAPLITDRAESYRVQRRSDAPSCCRSATSTRCAWPACC